MGGGLRALIAVVALGSALVGAAAADGAGRSGVSGRVQVPGPCVLPGPRCDIVGVAATIKVERVRTGRVVRTVHTRGGGHFRIGLRPGRYRLHATADGRSGTGSARVRVRRHRFTAVVIRLRADAAGRARAGRAARGRP